VGTSRTRATAAGRSPACARDHSPRERDTRSREDIGIGAHIFFEDLERACDEGDSAVCEMRLDVGRIGEGEPEAEEGLGLVGGVAQRALEERACAAAQARGGPDRSRGAPHRVLRGDSLGERLEVLDVGQGFLGAAAREPPRRARPARVRAGWIARQRAIQPLERLERVDRDFGGALIRAARDFGHVVGLRAAHERGARAGDIPDFGEEHSGEKGEVWFISRGARQGAERRFRPPSDHRVDLGDARACFGMSGRAHEHFEIRTARTIPIALRSRVVRVFEEQHGFVRSHGLDVRSCGLRAPCNGVQDPHVCRGGHCRPSDVVGVGSARTCRGQELARDRRRKRAHREASSRALGKRPEHALDGANRERGRGLGEPHAARPADGEHEIAVASERTNIEREHAPRALHRVLGILDFEDSNGRAVRANQHANARRIRREKPTQLRREKCLDVCGAKLDRQTIEDAASMPEPRDASRNVERKSCARDRRGELGHDGAADDRGFRELDADALAPDAELELDARLRNRPLQRFRRRGRRRRGALQILRRRRRYGLPLHHDSSIVEAPSLPREFPSKRRRCFGRSTSSVPPRSAPGCSPATKRATASSRWRTPWKTPFFTIARCSSKPEPARERRSPTSSQPR
jgi:hypothetical protein